MVLLENGADPKLWLEVFRTSKAISRTDRVWHELPVLVEVFWYGAMVDQLSLPGLVCFEVVSRRLLACIEAYTDPTHVMRSASRFHTGSQGLDNAAPAEMRTYISQAARELQDLEATRNRTGVLASMSGGGGGSVEDGGESSHAGGGGAKPKGKGKDGGGGGRSRAPTGPSP